MADYLVVRAFVSNQQNPSFEAKYSQGRFVLTPDPPLSQPYDRLQLYDGDKEPALILPVVECRFSRNQSQPYASTEILRIEGAIRNLFNKDSGAELKFTLQFAAQRKGQPLRLTIVDFFGCNLTDGSHCQGGLAGPFTMAQLIEPILTRKEGLKLSGTSLNRFLEKDGIEVLEGVIRRVVLPSSTGKLSAATARQLPHYSTLQLSCKATVKKPTRVRGLAIELQPADVLSYVQRPSLAWLNRDPSSTPADTWTLTADLPAARVCEWWNQAVAAPYIAALRTVKAGAPISMMPKLSSSGAGDNWRISYRIHEPSDGDPDQPVLDHRPPILVPLANVSAELTLCNLKPHEGDLVLKGIISPVGSVDPDSMDLHNRQLRIEFRFSADAVKGSSEATIVRLGAFDLQFGKTSEAVDPCTFRAVFRPDPDYANQLDNVSLVCNLPLIDALPAGQDDLPASEFLPEGFSAGCATSEDSDRCLHDEEQLENRFRREPPVILRRPVSQPAARRDGVSDQSPILLWLSGEETTRGNTSQTLRLSLRSRPVAVTGKKAPKSLSTEIRSGNSEDIKSDVLVLDRDPFLLAMVRYTPIRDLHLRDTQEVAWWTNASLEGAAWHVVSKLPNFELVLPPQTLGEAMLKGREIADKELVGFRFAPPAKQVLEASYTPQQFIEVPWNLRRILGFAGQRDPGAGIVELQYELLYGLACDVTPSEALRFAELFSTVGRIGGMIPPLPNFEVLDLRDQKRQEVKTNYFGIRKAWADLYGRYKSRLAVFELRRPGANFGRVTDVAKEPPEVLSLSDGVQCVFRPDASLYYPGWEKDPGAHGCEVSGDDSDFNTCSKGLKGGATWGFESPRLYRATVRNPRSDSAVLTGPYFSSLGGWGFQKVTFDNHRTTIYSHTAMGRVFSYSLERIGRIANYGNLAKHVIQYERSVVPSAQFAAQQNDLRGRPVVRKVHEFVEILEPEAELRRPQDDPICGFIRKIIFKTTIIPVLSEWGSNVGETGWKVPLWNRRQSLAQPHVYPIPEIAFEVAAGTGASHGHCGILEPDKLFFYTDTQKDGAADPHQWTLVPWVDFPPIPPPKPRPAFTSGTTNEQLQMDRDVPAGYRQFTYAVEALGAGVNLVDGRVDTAIAAVVRNVTVARTAAINEAQKGIDAASQLVEHVQNKYAELQRLCSHGEGAISTFAQNFCDEKWKQNLADLKSQLAEEIKKLFDAAADREKALISSFRTTLDTTIATLNEEIAAEFKVAWKPPIKKADLQNLADAEVILLEQRLEKLHSRAAAIRNALLQTNKALADFKKQYEAEYRASVLKLIGEVNGAQSDLARLRSDFASFEEEVRNRWAALHAQVSAVLSQWIPYASVVLDRVLGPLESAGQNSFQTLTLAIDEELRRPDAKLEIIKEKLGRPEDNPPAGLLGLPFPSFPWNETIKTALQQDYVGDLLTKIHDVVRDKLGQLLKPLPDPIVGSPDELLKSIRNALAPDQIRAAATKEIQDLDLIVGDQLSKAKTFLQNLVQPMANAASDPIAELEKLCTLGVTAARRQLTEWLRQMEAAAHRVLDSAAEALKNSPLPALIAQAADTPIQMLRAFGKPPQLPNLDFSLPELGYYFKPHIPALDLTPVLTQVKQLGPAIEGLANAINPLGTRLPSMQLLDRVIPPNFKLPLPNLPTINLSQFDLSSIFPDFGGLKLDNLFPNLKMPLDCNDKVRVTHGADPAARTAWVAADVDFTTDRTATLFSFGPMALSIPSARFRSRVEMVASQQQIERRASGSVSGDWELAFGGMKLVTLRDSALTFDNAGLHFNVVPEKVQLSGVLDFISKMLAQVTSPGNGFVAAATPTGFEARLDLPIPDISLGTFGISNLRLRNSFALDVAGEFKIRAGFALASRQAPANISIFILGGACAIETNVDYVPSRGELTCAAYVFISASASLAISLGPLQGGVYAFAGITIDFQSGGSQSRGLAMGATLLIRGQVSILSIVSAYVALGLDLTYGSGQLVGHGFFSIEIKICWCFTLSVSQNVTFNLASSGATARIPAEPVYLASMLPNDRRASDVPLLALSSPAPNDASDAFYRAADEYISMFAEEVA